MSVLSHFSWLSHFWPDQEWEGPLFLPLFLSSFWNVSPELVGLRVLLLSLVLPSNWLPQACGETTRSAPISYLYASPGSSIGSRQGISAGNDLHPLPHCKAAEDSAIQQPLPLLYRKGSALILGQQNSLWPILLSSFNFQMALSVWEGVLRITAWMSELQEKFEICSQSMGDNILSMLKTKGKHSKKGSREQIPSAWGCLDPLQNCEIVSIIWRNKISLWLQHQKQCNGSSLLSAG